MRRLPHRRSSARLLAGVFAAALVLGACGSDDNGDGGNGTDGAAEDGGEPEAVEIQFAWWGEETRHAATQEIIDAFEAEYPHVTVEPVFTDWESYWDRLATATAGDDAPDVMTHEERFMTDYALRDQLLDLNELDLDLSSIDELALAGGEIDGGLYGVATGVNAFTVLADPQAFADAGVDVPDDMTWTWEDYATLAEELSSDGFYGAQVEGSNEAGFNVFARQRGESLYTADGQLGFSAQTLADWWQLSLDIMAAGGAPSATKLLELEGPDVSLLATNDGAMGWWWTNQLGAISDASGRELELLRTPGESIGQQPGMYLKPAMYYSISSQTEHPEEAALFVDFLLNDSRSIEIMLTDRGLPANLERREEILPDLPETENQVAEFIAEIGPELADPPPPPPNGAGEIPDILTRMWEEVLFENLTPLEAAEQFMAEANAAIGAN